MDGDNMTKGDQYTKEILQRILDEGCLDKNPRPHYEDKYVGSSKSKGSTKGIINTKRIIPARISDNLRDKVETSLNDVIQETEIVRVNDTATESATEDNKNDE